MKKRIFTQLTALCYEDGHIADEGGILSLLRKSTLRQLETLRFARTSVGSESTCIKYIGQIGTDDTFAAMTNLRHLAFENMGLQATEPITFFGRLESLILTNTRLLLPGFWYRYSFSQLQYLDLTRCYIAKSSVCPSTTLESGGALDLSSQCALPALRVFNAVQCNLPPPPFICWEQTKKLEELRLIDSTTRKKQSVDIRQFIPPDAVKRLKVLSVSPSSPHEPLEQAAPAAQAALLRQPAPPPSVTSGARAAAAHTTLVTTRHTETGTEYEKEFDRQLADLEACLMASEQSDSLPSLGDAFGSGGSAA